MSSYLYCRECGNGLPSPEELTTKELLLGLFNNPGIECASCGALSSDYHSEYLVDELAIRIDGRF